MCKNYVDLNKDREEKIRDIIRKKEEFYYHGKKLNLIKTHEELMNWRPQYIYKEGVIEGKKRSMLKEFLDIFLRDFIPALFIIIWISIHNENNWIFGAVLIALILIGFTSIEVEEK